MFRQLADGCRRHPYLAALCAAGVACGTAVALVLSQFGENLQLAATVEEETGDGQDETLEDESEEETSDPDEAVAQADEEEALRRVN